MAEIGKPNLIRILTWLIILLGVLVLLLFFPAGTWKWLQAWMLVVFLLAYFLIYIFFGIYKDPEQTRERSKISSNVKRWDKVIMAIYTALLPTIFILAGLDVGRFKISTVPLFLQILAWCGLIFAGTFIMWTVRTNTYLSRYARIQEDREQEVIASGPYHFIRHPMYLGIITLFLCLGPALGSWLALISGLLMDMLFVIRTAKEDQMLREELSGYEDYARQVRHRLIPGIW